MADIFISYVEEDSDVALALSEGLEVAGYSTWCYERHSVPGPSYLAQTREAIEQSRVFLLVISRDSLGSSQIDKEVVRAHETSKRFLPVLRGITHPEFHARQPEWGQAAGGATGIQIPAGGVAEILPRIVRGLEMLRVEPGTAERTRVARPAAPVTSVPSPPARRSRPLFRRPQIAILVGLVALAVVAGAQWGRRARDAGVRDAPVEPGLAPSRAPTAPAPAAPPAGARPLGAPESVDPAGARPLGAPESVDPGPRVKPGGILIHVGAFRDRAAAARVAETLRAQGFSVVVSAGPGRPGPDPIVLYRVRVGPYGSREEAQLGLRALEEKGYKPFIIRASE